jgi:catalase
MSSIVSANDYQGGQDRTLTLDLRSVKFKLAVQIAAMGDKTDGPSIAWHDSRQIIELGQIEISKVAMDSDALKEH